MQTLTINIEDGFLEDFLAIVEHYKDKIHIQKDKNLEYDPYFYERQKQLQQDVEDIDNGKIELLSQKQYEKEMDNFFAELKST
ncbi:hypothetical protein RZR97_10415 [Hydrogenimonas thermophila]|uniref:hypothetical protein n=1 Tax=Hydrogenimonas thermophila TaxID=223786 RepID=UPI0029372FAA|nr:hypothetical protein [Hydrogenimonas thermophila]WOE69512.1 hypothetical protein RZR91_10440 [Hydrogenimonas thermophila]WOE72023.1 hypothetical protein RZR97_10415 [Hydrogenimonas thermophila]